MSFLPQRLFLLSLFMGMLLVPGLSIATSLSLYESDRLVETQVAKRTFKKKKTTSQDQLLFVNGIFDLHLNIKKVESKSENAFFKISKQILSVFFLAEELLFDVTFEDGSIKSYAIRTKYDEKKILDLNCKKNSLILKINQPSPDFFQKIIIGTSCFFKDNSLVMTISMPEGVDFLESDFFETSGKGENYRSYSIPPGKIEGSLLGSFKAEYNRQNLIFKVYSEKKKQEVTSKKNQKTTVLDSVGLGLGSQSNKISASDLSYTSSGFSYSFFANFNSVIWKIKPELRFTNSVYDTNENYISFSEIDISLAYWFSVSRFDFGLGFYGSALDINHKGSTMRLQSEAVGTLIKFSYQINIKNKLVLNIQKGLLTSEGILSQQTIQISDEFSILKNQDLWFYFGYENQLITAKNSYGIERKFLHEYISVGSFWRF